MTRLQRQSLALLLSLLIFMVTPGCAGTGGKTDKAKLDIQADAARLEEQTEMTVVSVLIDLPTDTGLTPPGDVMEKTLRDMPGYMKDFMLKIEYIPPHFTGQEREAAISRVRTEIMAGEGPDLFICAQKLFNVTAGPEDQAVFNFPVQAMKNHLFLPLDEYIEKAEYLDMDALQPVVMAAGRNEEGQQILPLAYTFRATLFDREEYTPTAELPMTWEEMAEDPDPAIRVSCGYYLPNVIGELADYSKDEPAFSEEELCALAIKWQDTWLTVPENLREEDRPLFLPIDMQCFSDAEVDLAGEREYTIIPSYNLSGGVTADITTFGAINRNARCPEEAFRILDYLMDPEIQQTSPLFQGRMEGLPVYTGTGNSDTPANSYWQMNETNYQAITQAQEHINIANFPGPVDAAVSMVLGYNPEVAKKSAHEQYVLMKMVLAES